MKLSGTQKLVKFFSSSAKFDMIKAESMTWHFTCSSCGNTASIWEIGGVRYKASGKPLVSIKCPKCGRIAMQSIKKSDAT